MKTKKIVPVLMAFIFFTKLLSAQLQNGSIAPDWTMTDINKKVWHLYDLTSKGKTVFIDISATWCGPCWNYHNKHSLDSLYDEHGPNGTIDHSLYVFLIEGDPGTNYADLSGTGKHSYGNWIKGNSFPIIDPGADTIYPFRTNYNIMYFPTVYMICPDNKIYLVGPGTKDVLYKNTKSGCAPVIENKNWKGFGFNSDQTEFPETVSKTKEEKFDFLFLFRKRFSILRTPNS
jgi:hypothetical protein